jgi:hypothetical protein
MTKLSELTIVIPAHVHNEKFLRALHNSQWATVLVIDQNSDIDFKILKKEYEFDIFTYPKLISFSDMKNAALAEVTTQWVFFLDSDEWCSDQLVREIADYIEQDAGDGFAVKRIDYFLGEWVTRGEIANQLMVRVGKTAKVKWRGDVHETLEVSGKNIIRLDEPLYHEPHDSVYDFIDSVNRYTSQEAKTQKKDSVVMKSMLWPVGKFLWNYVCRFGFLDGWRGFIYSLVMSIHSNAVRVKRYER